MKMLDALKWGSGYCGGGGQEILRQACGLLNRDHQHPWDSMNVALGKFTKDPPYQGLSKLWSLFGSPKLGPVLGPVL